MTLSDLPVELEFEILSKVPAKSLTQLRSTCKRWYALFKDPRFIKKNMEKAATQLILKMHRNVYSVNINLPNKSIEFTGQFKSLKDPKLVSISRIFPCDGLLLCTMRDINGYVVWNPCTGQTRWITSSPNGNRNAVSFDCCVSIDYALGYDNNSSYKILRICSYNELMPVLEIYEFSSDSWRVLEEDVTDQKWIIKSREVSLKGNSYWIAWDKKKENSSNKFLLKFDFERERFESLSLPSECNNNDREVNVVLSSVGQEKLSVLLEKFIEKSLEIKIWVTHDTIKIQYSLVIDSGIIMRECLKRVDSFLVDEEKKRVVCCGPCGDGKREESAVIYFVGDQDQDPKNNNVCKQVYGMSPEVLDVFRPHLFLFSYVPSLVHIQNSKQKKKVYPIVEESKPLLGEKMQTQHYRLTRLNSGGIRLLLHILLIELKPPDRPLKLQVN